MQTWSDFFCHFLYNLKLDAIITLISLDISHNYSGFLHWKAKAFLFSTTVNRSEDFGHEILRAAINSSGKEEWLDVALIDLWTGSTDVRPNADIMEKASPLLPRLLSACQKYCSNWSSLTLAFCRPSSRALSVSGLLCLVISRPAISPLSH